MGNCKCRRKQWVYSSTLLTLLHLYGHWPISSHYHFSWTTAVTSIWSFWMHCWPPTIHSPHSYWRDLFKSKGVLSIWNSHTLLMEMDLVWELQETLVTSSSTKYLHTLRTSSFTPRYTSNRNANIYSPKDNYRNIYSSIICNKTKLGTIQMSLNSRVFKLWYIHTMDYM